MQREQERTRQGILGSLSATGVAFLAACVPDISRSTEKRRLSLDEQQILQASQKLPITPGQREAEIALWSMGSVPNLPPLPMSEATFPAAQAATEVRVRTTLDLMAKSNNPRFREAIDFYASLNPNDISFIIVGFILYRGKEFPHRVNPQVENGAIRWYIHLSASHFVNRSDSVIQALTLTNALEEVRLTEQFVDVLPSSFTPEQKLKAWIEHVSKTENHVIVNARVFAKEAEAYVYAYGLGYRRGWGTSYERYAAQFIRTGKSATNSDWREFIRREQGL